MSDDPSASSSRAAGPPDLTAGARAATCPFMRTLLVHNAELYDPGARTMAVSTLKRFVREQRAPGVDGSLERVLAFFARVNQTPWGMKLANLVPGRENLFSTDFPGSKGDHPGSTDIYSRTDGSFDPTAFERVVAHSSDGETMTTRDMAAAIVEANANPANPGSPIDLANSAGEFALLFNLLGTPERTLRIADMRLLFERNEWPPGALENLGRATAAEWVHLTREIMSRIAELKLGGAQGGRAKKLAMRHLGRLVHQVMTER